uniref:Nuclear pore complex protein n=2 Tax=Anthurium amnicola TaxID=1678845 RepID=A0A1D1YQA4_9ARAE
MLTVCTDWESACWAMAKSWLDVQVDLELSRFHQARVEQIKNYGGDVNGISEEGQTSQSSVGSESWPGHVIDQQPRDLPSLLQKLHSSDNVHEAVSRACKEQHRQIEMNLMTGDIANLLDLLWSWICPVEGDQNVLRPQGDPQVIRFSAHIVLVLRYLFPDEMKDTFKKKLMTVGDYILHMYAMLLFSKQHEELVGVYASQLASHLCIDLFVHMMEQKLNDSLRVKYKIFHSAILYLPFSLGEDSKACFEDIIKRVLSRSREAKVNKYDGKLSDIAEQHRLQSLQKANAVQWLCFTPPSTIGDFAIVNAKLLMRALMHSNILFREFALISLWRVPKMPIGAHKLLSFLVELLKQPMDTLLSLDELIVSENLHEFEDWRAYYSCDATYRNWLKIEQENADIPPSELSREENERAIAAAKETLASSHSLLQREGNPWLSLTQSGVCEPSDHVFIELHATAMLCLPSGECLQPDATVCTTLTSALYTCIGEEDALKRQVMINVAISSKDEYCIEVALRCIAVDGDGLGLHDGSDGGILAAIMAAGFKGELSRFQSGVKLEISRLDACYSHDDGSLQCPATYIVRGLCRRCCLPELILRCMQVSLSLTDSGDSSDHHNDLVELVASSQSGMLNLFSQHQLQEFLLFERECALYKMELLEEYSTGDS